MTRRPGALLCALLVIMVSAASACRRGNDAAHLTELQRVKSGALDVVLLSDHDALRHGSDGFIIEFRTASSGALTDVGTIRASANMPMPGMPMFGNIQVQRTDVTGRYAATGEFSMAGTWRFALEWSGPAGRGSVTFSGTVQ